MHRRSFLQLLSATALTAAYVRPGHAAPSLDHVVVIGAGIIGAATAYRLARRGVRVTVLEKTAPASGATGDSFAYLNASTKPDRAYHQLNALGIAGWHRLQVELNGALPLRWGGAVYWRADQAAARNLLSTLRRCQEWGYAARRIDETELRRLLPNVVPGPVASAVLYEQEGVVDPSGAVDVLLGEAKKLGATVHFPVEVTGLDAAGDRIRGVRTSDGAIGADAVVVAAGLGSEALVNALGVKLPLVSSSGVLVHTEPQPPLLERAVFAPGSTIKQDVSGRIVSSIGHEGSIPAGQASEQGKRILQSAARYFPGLQEARIARVSEGRRVLPADGFPVVGFAGKYTNLYIAVSHSGVTLAPVIAQFATQELLDGVAVEPLAPYRPSRFA